MYVETSTVRISAGSLRVVHVGHVGRPLVVVHGGPDWDHSYLIPAVSALVDSGIQPILFDIRGCGGSMRFDCASAYTVRAVVQDICELLDALGLVRADFLGFSFGGIVAQELLATYPARVGRLALAATAYPWEPTTPEAPSQSQPGSLEARIKWLFSSEPDPRAASRMLAEESLQLDVHLESSLAAAQRLIANVSFSGEWMTALRARRVQEHRRVRIEDFERHGDRLLLLHGANDRRFSVSGALATHALAPRSRLGVIPEAGHLAFLDAPNLWNRHLADFLGRSTDAA